MPPPLAEFVFPGIDAIISASGTCITGTRPALFQVETLPMFAPTRQVGDLEIKFGSLRRKIRDAAVVEGSFRFNQAGQIIGMIIEDRRWKWRYTVLDGHYNVKDKAGKIIESTKKNLREICKECLKQMEETKYDVSQVTTEKFPEVKWVAANGAEELQSLADEAGCRVVLHYLNDGVKFWKIGSGGRLPTEGVIEGGQTLEAKALPSSILFVGGRTLYQLPLKLRAVGMDIKKYKNKVVPIDDLSYTPKLANGEKSWREEIPGVYENVIELDERNEDEGREKLELAQRTVFRWYEIVIPKEGIKIPYRKEKIKDPREFLDILPSLAGSAQIIQDKKNVELQSEIPPRIIGTFFSEGFENNAIEPLTDSDFNVHGIYNGSFQINSRALRVEFDRPVYRNKAPVGNDGFDTYHPAELYLFTAFSLQTAEGKEDRLRLERKFPKLKSNKTGPHVVQNEDVVLVINTGYQTRENQRTGLMEVIPGSKPESNGKESGANATAAIDIEEQKFQRIPGRDVLYEGIVPIELDGAILQVQWTRPKGGSSLTRVSVNNEFPTPLPTEDERKKIIKQQKMLRDFDIRQGKDPRARYQNQTRIP